jgi:hypothetical protein
MGGGGYRDARPGEKPAALEDKGSRTCDKAFIGRPHAI